MADNATDSPVVEAMADLSTTTTTTAATTTVAMTTTTMDPVVVFHQTIGQLVDFTELARDEWDPPPGPLNPVAPRQYTHWNAVNIARLALAIFIISANMAVVGLVLAKAALRCRPKNLLIITVAVANVIMGAFVIPGKLHFTLNPEVVDCDLAVVWHFICDYFQPCLSLLAVLCLVAERFIYVYTEKHERSLTVLCKVLVTLLLLILPWALATVLLLPTFFYGLLARAEAPSCLFKVDDSYLLACQLLAFIPPSFGVFIMAPCTGLLDCLKPKSCYYKPETPHGESSRVTTVVSLFSVVCELPFCIVKVIQLRMECNSPECSTFADMITLTMWIRLAKAAIFPFFWLAYTDIREAMKCECDWEYCCGDNYEDYDEVSNNIEEEPGIPLASRS